MATPTWQDWRNFYVDYPSVDLPHQPVWDRILWALCAWLTQTNPDGTPIIPVTTSAAYWDVTNWDHSTWQ